MVFPPRSRDRLGRSGLGLVAVVAGWLAGPARPAAAAGFESWKNVEQAQETKDYGNQVREGRFDAEQRAFVEQTLLPQLALEANRFQIATVRQRIRELALRGVTKKDLAEQINALIRDAMLRVAADKAAADTVRVNAILLVGELEGLDRGPWPGSLEPVAKAAGDAALPLAVRAAAMQGLTEQVEAGGAGAKAAAPVVAALIATPPAGDPVAVGWLVARALDLLPAVSAPTAAVKAAAGILAAGAADTDLRVRAALAVGRLATPETGIDAAAASDQIRSLAISAVTADLDAAAARRLDREQPGGGGPEAEGGPIATPPVLRLGPPEPRGGPFGGPPGGLFGGPVGGGGELGAEAAPPVVFDEYAVPPLACRRNAWRLFTLAEAVQPARPGPGLAGLLEGQPAAAARALAQTMRQAAADLDARPDEQTLAAALAALRKLAPAPAAAGAATSDRAGEAEPPSPFDQPARN